MDASSKEDSKLDMSQWIKFSIGSSAEDAFSQELSALLDLRQREIEAQRALDADEPPQANAFALTVFSMHPDFDTRAEDILRIAFEDHPKYDYCVYMAPNNAPPLQLAQSSMIVAQLRPGVSFDQTLYVLHRQVLLAPDFLGIARMTEKLIPALGEFASKIPGPEKDELLLQAG